MIMLHNKNEVPTFLGPHSLKLIINTRKRLSCLAAAQFWLQFSAKKITMNERLKTFGSAERKCRFVNENEGLKLFTNYSQGNCLFECKLEMARDLCGCIPWFVGNTVDPVCDLFGNKCFEQATLKIIENIDFNDKDHLPCNCLPDCNKLGFYQIIIPNLFF